MAKEQSLFSADEYKKSIRQIKNKKEEDDLQKAFCEYVRTNHPDIIFTSDLASGMKLPIWIAARNAKMRSSRALPDFTAYRMMVKHYDYDEIGNGGGFKVFHGFILEIKKAGTVIYLKNGQMTANKHIREQEAILERLRKQGYFAEFGIGLKHCVELFEGYLNLGDVEIIKNYLAK